MEPTFTLVGEGDLDTLLELMHAYYTFDHIPFRADWARRMVERLIADPNLGRIWLIRSGTETVGYLVLCVGYGLEFGRDAFLDELFIVEARRGQGIGRAAVKFAAAQCPALGVQALHLVVTPGNDRAYHLYESLGFEDQNRRLMTRWIAKPPAP
jgi:ribosomal protein S18 acetylase RimI-like enzyme